MQPMGVNVSIEWFASPPGSRPGAASSIGRSWHLATRATQLALTAAAAATALAVAPVPALALPSGVMAVATLAGAGCPQVRLSEVDRGGSSLGASASADVNAVSQNQCESPMPWTGYAIASVDAADGSLHATTYAAESGKRRTAQGWDVATSAGGILRDTLYLEGGNSGHVTFGLRVDGMVRTSGEATVRFDYCMGVSSGDVDPQAGASCGHFQNYRDDDPFVGQAIDQEFDRLLRLVVAVSEEPLNIFLLIGATTTDGRAGGTAVADFGHTARLSIDLPDGMSFRSESGYLLVGHGSVPEPGTALLALAPLLAWRFGGRFGVRRGGATARSGRRPGR